jgi:hypothetical protein
MSKFVDMSPDPKSHVKTLMRIGYTMSSAVADILDNSITAGSKRVDIYSPPGLDEPLISILDDGCGMGTDELIQNMQIGCKDPSLERGDGDLGRFGSGMKTASFSQARRLTVVSKKEGSEAIAAVWDIDKIEETNSWCLEVLSAKEISSINGIKIDSSTTQGTQVIWENLACLQRGSHALDPDIELATRLSTLREYLALHFHRFMDGKNKVSFYLNRNKILPIDPFMSKSDGYQEGRSEKLRCKGGHIRIQTHVLPHFNKMDNDAMKGLGGANGITQNQGLYIYRERRLINAGGWLGLAKNSQLGALARVQVDVPSSIDNEWSTDVKKSSLQLPLRVKKELRKFLSDPITRSKRTHAYRGSVDKANKFWKVCEDENEGTVTYQIDTDNVDLIELLHECNRGLSTELIQYLKELSTHLPINHIYEKMSESPRDIDQGLIDFDQMLHELLNDRTKSGKDAL